MGQSCKNNLATAGWNGTINFGMYGIAVKSTARRWILCSEVDYCPVNSTLHHRVQHHDVHMHEPLHSLACWVWASRDVYRSASPSRTGVTHWALSGSCASPLSRRSVVVICPSFSHLAEQWLNCQTAKKPFWHHAFNCICSSLQKHWSCFGQMAIEKGKEILMAHFQDTTYCRFAPG